MIVEARFNRKEGGNILEEEIVLRLNRGDPAALEALIDCYAPYVCGVAARILPGRPEEWEELAGDVFLAAWDNRKKLRPGQVKGWLSTVARNRAFNRRRGHREDLPLEEDILLLQSDLPQSEAEYRERGQHYPWLLAAWTSRTGNYLCVTTTMARRWQERRKRWNSTCLPPRRGCVGAERG